ncbi:kelch-like protein diablo [Hetaerina americana]|uniref:kelch-like protein diablo n=1 Tax=Hetaerina americana TaxID=62018 RepID=UPI003A7F2F51
MEEPRVFRDEFFPQLLLESLREMRNSGALCDVILICDGEIPAHRLVLSAASPYFRGMFNLGLKESKEERIEIECMDGVVLRAAIDFMYSGELKASDDILLPLLEASSLLQLGSLRSACMHELVQSATPYSALESCGSVANKLGLVELENFFHRLTIEHFEKVAFGDSNQQWLDAPAEAISPLFNHFSIFSYPAALVLKAILAWVLHDTSGNREEHLKTLSHIVKDVNKSELDSKLKSLISHKPDIYEWLSSLCAEIPPAGEVPNKKELQVVVVIGGLSPNGPIKTVECYTADSPISTSWTLYLPDNTQLHHTRENTVRTNLIDRIVPPMKCARVYAASAFLDYEIYVIGGECDWAPMSGEASMECYNTLTNSWKSLPGVPLSQSVLEVDDEASEQDCLRLVGAAAAFVEGDLYVCGGKFEVVKHGENIVYAPPSKWMLPFGFSKGTWAFNATKNKWRKCNPLLQARAYHGAASINGVLYAVGGIGATCKEHLTDCLDSVERFEPWSGVWRNVKLMPSPRAYFGCITFSQYIYVVGGHNLDCCKDTVFKYDTITDNWHVIEHHLRTPVDSLAACSLKYPVDTPKNVQTHAFLLGGRNSHSGIRDANIYNFATNRWHCLQSLICGRVGANAGMLRAPATDPSAM